MHKHICKKLKKNGGHTHINIKIIKYAYKYILYENKKYYIPQKRFFPKINDFGLSNLNNEYKNQKLYKSKCKDIYNLILDVYDGSNLGSIGLCQVFESDSYKLNFIKEYFSNFFNVHVIDEYLMISKNQMKNDWDNILDDEFLESIEIKNPQDLLNNYFYKIFGKINENISFPL